MNENAKLWVEALRSGEYKQTKRALRTLNGYCCLGVACEVYRQETSFGKWSLTGDEVVNEGRHFRFVVQDGDGGVRLSLPSSVRNWLGLTDEDGQFVNDCLAICNDRGHSFEAIADLIETEPEGLFDHE